jgi:dTDP-4-dehydrorhamnose 3,5-epimerase-like enzyme
MTSKNKQQSFSKLDVARALRMSPSTEQVIMYESGKAYDIALKIRELKTANVTVLVIK